MAEIAGMIKPELQALPQISDRMTFLYLEHCKINRQDSAITVLNEQGDFSYSVCHNFCASPWTWYGNYT